MMLVLGLLSLSGGIAVGYTLGYLFPPLPAFRFAPCDCVMFKRELAALLGKHAACPKPRELMP
jgi:hypothetical protein